MEEYTVLPFAEKEKESIPSKALRNVTRTAARATESVLGLPGDIASGALGLGGIASEKLLGKPFLPSLREHIPTSETVKKYVTEPIGKLLPEKYLEPQSKEEEISDEFFSDLSSLLVPLGGSTKLGHSALVAGSGNIAKWATKELGGSERAQTGAKIGGMLLSSLGGLRKTNQYMRSLYDKAEQLLPTAYKAPAPELSKKMGELNKSLNVGIMTPSKKALLEPVDAIQSILQRNNNLLPTVEAISLKRDINELIRDADFPDAARKQMKSVVNDINKSINRVGETYPEFLKTIIEADNVLAGLNEGSKVSHFLNKHLTASHLFHPITLAILGIHGATGGLSTLAQSAGGVFGSLALKEGYGVLESFAKSSGIRNYYAKTVGAALKGNAPQALKYANKLDQEIKKQEQEQGEFIVL